MTTYRTLSWKELSNAQARAAKAFAAQHESMTVSQCAKYLNHIFALKRGEITLEQFKQQTGWDGAPFVKES